MTRIYNRKSIKQVRRLLRIQATTAERKLWYRLRYHQLGVSFLRQYSVDRFVLDFYCPKHKLAIELDGGQHNIKSIISYDQERTLYLTNLGITVIRFWNQDVIHHMDAVLEKIKSQLTKSV